MHGVGSYGLLAFSIFCFCCLESCLPENGFMEEEVVFRNNADGAILAGTLTRPFGEGKFPVAVLISGGGQQDRDETVYGHKPFKVLAEFLSQNGIAVLRFDDRGKGGSKGDVWNATLEVLASDAYAGVQYLKTRKDIDYHNRGIGIPWSENHILADSLSNKLKGESDATFSAPSKVRDKLSRIVWARCQVYGP